MVKMKFDVRDSDPDKAVGQADFEPPPPGVYPAKLLEVTQEYAKDRDTGKPDKSRPMLVMKYELAGKAKGAWIWDRIVLSDAAKWKLDQVLQAFGIATKRKRTGEVDFDELVGEACQIRVRGGTYKGEYSAEVGAVLMPKDEDDLDDQGENEDLEDDEIPEDDDEGIEDDEGEEAGEFLYYDMKELAGMQLPGLKDVAADLELEVPAAKAKNRVALSKWIFENQPGEAPEEEEETDVSLDDLGEAADGEDEEAMAKLTELAESHDLDPDEYETWSELATAIEGAEGPSEDGEESGESESEDGYDELSIDDLKSECKDRELSVSGNKAALIKRLREDDEEEPF